MYTATKVLPITRQIELIGKKKFAVVAFDLKNKIFVIHIVFFVSSKNVYPFCRAQIALLKIDRALTTVFPEYSNIADVFSPKLEVEVPEYIEINDHVIDLINGKQPPY